MSWVRVCADQMRRGVAPAVPVMIRIDSGWARASVPQRVRPVADTLEPDSWLRPAYDR